MAEVLDHIENKAVSRSFPFYNNCNKQCNKTLTTSAHLLFLYVGDHGMCVTFCYKEEEFLEMLNGSQLYFQCDLELLPLVSINIAQQLYRPVCVFIYFSFSFFISTKATDKLTN